ncbi:MAG: hypothetical protein JWQ87_2237 [Candidatus Sulfotelmatobacter sp.]|nr:hypothetical protein [Candidatus Sulfotelmatobacter sp.]
MKVHIKVWTTDLGECETFVFPCQSSMVKELVERFVNELEAQFPGNKFKTVPIGLNRYNVVPQPQATA